MDFNPLNPDAELFLQDATHTHTDNMSMLCFRLVPLPPRGQKIITAALRLGLHWPARTDWILHYKLYLMTHIAEEDHAHSDS